MALEFAKPFYHSRRWQECRKAFIAMRQASDGGICQDCGERPGRVVHHIKPITPDNINDPDVTLNFRNLRYVCHMCHEQEEHARFQSTRVTGQIDYMFDEDGNPICYERDSKGWGR